MSNQVLYRGKITFPGRPEADYYGGSGGRSPRFNLREFVMNSRHPDPRRVWKVGSVAHWLPPLPVHPLDPVDPLQCAKRWFRLRETLLFRF